MKMTKLTKTALIAGVALSIGATPLIGAHSASAATLISQSTYEKVMSFTKSDIKTATGINLDANTVTKTYNALKQTSAWSKLGYNAADSKRIAARFTQSQFQAVGILTEMAKSTSVTLKVVTINKPYYETVNIGSMGTTTTPTNPSTPDESTDESTSGSNETSTGTSVLGKDIKELDVDIEYNKKDIEFEYEVKSNGTIKAKYENEFAGVKLEGKAAQTKIESIFAGLDLKNSTNAQIKNHVINKLGAGSNFKKFEFEAKYANKTKLEFKIKN